MKTTLRYLLSLIAVVSVLSLSAQTPNYGKPYKHPYSQAGYNVQVNEQLPAATIGSINEGYVQSGSNLPSAAVTGVTTTYDKNSSISRPRRGADEGDTPPDDPHGPNEDPLGDVMWPMALCALANAIYKVSRMRRRVHNE